MQLVLDRRGALVDVVDVAEEEDAGVPEEAEGEAVAVDGGQTRRIWSRNAAVTGVRALQTVITVPGQRMMPSGTVR